nr:Hok/Gef family protein [Escherichia coli]
MYHGSAIIWITHSSLCGVPVPDEQAEIAAFLQ